VARSGDRDVPTNGRPPCGEGILAGNAVMTRRTVGAWAGVFFLAASITGCMSTGSGMAANSRTAGIPTAKANNAQWPSTATAIAKQNQSAPKTAATTAVAEATPTAQTKPITPPTPPTPAATPSSLTPPTPVPATDAPPPTPAATLTPNNSSMKSLTAGTAVADAAKPAVPASPETSARVSLPVPSEEGMPANSPPVPATPGPMGVPTPATTASADVAIPPVSLASSPAPFPAPTKVRQ
jgi:hypothetical protein